MAPLIFSYSEQKTAVFNWMAWSRNARSFWRSIPANGEVIGTCVRGGREKTAKAVAAALRAFRDPAWKSDRWLRAW